MQLEPMLDSPRTPPLPENLMVWDVFHFLVNFMEFGEKIERFSFPYLLSIWDVFSAGSKPGRADGEGAYPNVSRGRPPRRGQPGGHGYNERPRMQRSTPRLEDNGYKSAAPESPSNNSPLLRQEKNFNILTCGHICPHG